MNTLTDEDIAVMFPERAKRPKAQPATEAVLKVKTADEIVAEARGETPVSAGTGTAPASKPSRTTGAVFADAAPSKPAPTPTAPATDSPELIELRAIRREIEALAGYVLAGVNKMGKRG